MRWVKLEQDVLAISGGGKICYTISCNDRSVKAEICGRRWFCCRSNWSLRRCSNLLVRDKLNLWLTVWPSVLGIMVQSIIACHGHVTVYWMFIGCTASSSANCCIIVRWLSTFTNVYHDSPHGGCIITGDSAGNSCSNVFICFIKYT